MRYMQWCLHAYIYTRVSLYACHIFRDEANMLAVCTINKNLIYSPEHTTTHIEMGTKMSNTAALPIAIPRCNCTVQKNFNYIWSSHLHACISVSLKRILCTSQVQSVVEKLQISLYIYFQKTYLSGSGCVNHAGLGK